MQGKGILPTNPVLLLIWTVKLDDAHSAYSHLRKIGAVKGSIKSDQWKTSMKAGECSHHLSSISVCALTYSMYV